MKLIKLPDGGPYVPADSIFKITGPYYGEDCWFYVIGYQIKGEEKQFNQVELNTTFVKSKERAELDMDKFVNRLNEML